jgi:predicted DCC family thiol-disulfide oxidoreductase YuxK
MERVTVLYDRDCGFCRWSVALLLRLDRRGAVRAEPIQGPQGDRLLAGMPTAARLAAAHGVTPDGRVFSGGDAVPPVLAALGARPWVVAGARALRGPLRWGYRQVAGRRSALGRLVSDRQRGRADGVIARHQERAGLRGSSES